MKISRRGLVLSVVVFFLGLTLPGYSVGTEEAIRQLILEAYDLDPQQHEVEITSNQLKTTEVNLEDLTFRAISQKSPIGPFTIKVAVNHEGETVEKGQVHLRIKHYAKVLVALDKVKRHESLVAEKFGLKKMDVTSLREQSVSSLEEILGQRSKRNLPGKVLQTGWAGQAVRVKNRASGKIILARVVDAGSVTVGP